MDNISSSNVVNPEIDWQLQQKSLTERALYILKTSLWTDCKFIVGTGELKKEFTAHKLILAMASPVFGALFQSGFSETKNDIIIVDIEPEPFGEMLKYVYGDQIVLKSFELACGLGYAAHKYMMPNLFELCLDYIRKKIDVSNVCRGYELGKLFDQHDLMGMCIKIICEETSKIINNASFCDVGLSTVEIILDQDSLAVESEVELFNAIEKWTAAQSSKLGHASQECEDEQKTVNAELVQKIRFSSMSPKEFAEGPARSPLLTKDKSFSILMHLNSASYPLQPGFSTRTRDFSRKRGLNTTQFCANFNLNITKVDIGPLNCWITLYCYTDVKIWGLQFVRHDDFTQRTNLTINLNLMDIETRVSQSVTAGYVFNARPATVMFSKPVNRPPAVIFPKSVNMLRCRQYSLEISSQMFMMHYMIGPVDIQEIRIEDVKFSILGSSKNVFVTGLIFSKS